jgi:hypothetical protein
MQGDMAMSNQMILEFAHKRIHELELEMRDMEQIIAEYDISYDNMKEIEILTEREDWSCLNLWSGCSGCEWNVWNGYNEYT